MVESGLGADHKQKSSCHVKCQRGNHVDTSEVRTIKEVEESSLAQRVLVLRRGITDVETTLGTTDTIVRVGLVGLGKRVLAHDFYKTSAYRGNQPLDQGS